MSDLDKLTADEIRVRLEQCEALCKFARHNWTCSHWNADKDGPCDCGYDAARAALEGKCPNPTT